MNRYICLHSDVTDACTISDWPDLRRPILNSSHVLIDKNKIPTKYLQLPSIISDFLLNWAIRFSSYNVLIYFFLSFSNFSLRTVFEKYIKEKNIFRYCAPDECVYCVPNSRSLSVAVWSRVPTPKQTY